MKISPEEVARIAALARLDLDEDKKAMFAGQFTDILGYMDILAQVDTKGVEPLYSPVDHVSRMREDVVRKDFSRAEILGNAPQTDGAFFIVPKIV